MMRVIVTAIAMMLAALVAPAARAQMGPMDQDAAPVVRTPSLSDTLSQLSDPTRAGGINPLSVLESAARALPGVSGGGGKGGESQQGGLSAAINIMVVLSVISLVPSIMLMCTCFVRILVVLGLLRQALGTQSIPPPQVITALALFMTLLVMSPTIDRINREAIQPYRAGEVRDYDTLWARARQPVRDFMFAQIEATGNWSSLYMVLQHRGVDVSEPEALKRSDVDMVSLVPAYMLSELKTAFLMGFKIYLPFLVIDLVISTMLISMSMMMVPPVMVSLPFKLLLFVLVDGWTLVVGGLMGSFEQPTPEVAGVIDGVRDVMALHAPVLREAVYAAWAARPA